MARLLPALVIASAALHGGCVSVYQPLSSLQRPVVVDPAAPNLEGVKLLVRCIPGSLVGAADAQVLCRKLTTLFTNQGASVESDVPREGRASPEGEEKPDLVLDVETRLLHAQENLVLDAISYVTGTIIPMNREESFAQDVTIRDGDGALLATDSLQARFIHSIGIGVWGVNWVLDKTMRSVDEQITGDGAREEFSRDLYRQLSQLVFNARIRAQVLRGFAAGPAAPSKQ